MKQLPIGIDDYKIVLEQCYYIDKTLFIKEIDSAPDNTIFLFTRPRRFGKSLMLSMLDYFYAKDVRDAKRLFDNKNIAHHLDIMEHQGQYPVIHLDFKNAYADTLMNTTDGIVEALKSTFKRHEYLLSSPKLSDKEKQLITSLIDGSASIEEYATSLRTISELILKSENIPPILLIDEYDSPIMSQQSKKEIDFIKRLLSSALKGNTAIKKGVLTGVMKISKESLFSGLNNLRTYGILDKSHAEYFGFTLNETKEILSDYHFNGNINEVINWYGGYHFGDDIIFNPWSILNFIDNGFSYKSYWVNTSNNRILEHALSSSNYDIFKCLNDIISNQTIVTPLDESITIYDTLDSSTSLYSLLVYTGYLTPINVLDSFFYNVGVPNKEVKNVFSKEIIDRYSPSLSLNSLYLLRSALLANNEIEIKDCLKKYFLSVLTYFDVLDEKNYQIMLLTLTSILFSQNEVRSEVNAGDGRCDIMIIPRRESVALVLEIKTSSAKKQLSSKQMEDRCISALKRIESRHYHEYVMNDPNIKKIYTLGFCFNKRNVEVLSKVIDK